MDFLHTLLNILAPLLTFIVFIFLFPPYMLYKFLVYIFTFTSPENVAGKVVLITGASSGIGEHLAYEYARRGAYLVLAARRQNSLRQVADTALLLGSPDVITLRTDVTKVEDCNHLIDEAVNNFGRLDHLVNNAGITSVCMFEDIANITNIASVMDVNYWGSVYTTHFAIPHLRNSRGKIIGIASSAVWMNIPRISFYNARLIESEITQGKFLSKEGRLELDQEMRDVEMNLVPIESVERCAKAIVNSVCQGDKHLVVPKWVRYSFYMRTFWPESVQWLSRLLLLTPQGIPPQEAIGKKLLDLTGLKKTLYPDSVLSPKLRVD